MGRETRDPLRFRRRALLGVWLLSGAAVLARAGQVQLVQGAEWRAAALAQQRTAQAMPAPRGRILDREGVPLAETREFYEVAVAPREVGDREAVLAGLQEVLGLSERRARRIVDSRDGWEVVGRFPASVHGRLRGIRGIHLTRQLRRDYPQGRMALGVLGTARDGEGRGGVEQHFDDHLRGTPGRAVVARDPQGDVRSGQVFQMETPRPGGDLVLTLDADLQAISREELAAAIDTTAATGGDLLVADPHTGEILAAVSIQDGADAGLGFITVPVEPGSTMKPFALATLLNRGRATVNDRFDTGDGVLRECRETWSDTRPHGEVTLAQAVEVSSNVALGMAVQRLDPVEQWEGLRDFGFGQLTGIPVPGESPGRLRRADDWSCTSPTAHAIGYEVSATPLQIVMAYGALANGGELMEPRLVREIRHPGGRRQELEPRVIRRVLRPEVAREMTDVLVNVVNRGTGQAARLSTFSVAGKTGTARAWRNGSYASSQYFSSFVGYFPAEAPQLVIYARLDDVDGYGGTLAAPVTRAVMEAALASRGTPLQVPELQQAARPQARPAQPVARFASREPAPAPTSPTRAVPASAASAGTVDVRVPELGGMSLREAARRLHAMGLRVEIRGSGVVRGTRPRTGALVQTGDTVVLRTRQGER